METRPHRGIEIEVCPDCGAVLLDPGELELLAGRDQAGVMKGLLNFLGRD
jgi:Zn-finger nucleic acid-binding protein